MTIPSRRQRHGLLPTLAILTLASAVAGCNGSSTAASTTTTPSPSLPAAATVGSISPALPGRLVFRRYLDASQTAGALFTSRTDGSGERQVLTPPAGAEDGLPDWSPDGRRLLFTRTSGVAVGHESHTLWTISSSGGTATALTAGKPAHGNTVPGFDDSGTYSPDGKWIAYAHAEGKVAHYKSSGSDQLQKSNIFVMDTNGKHAHQITRFPDYAGDASGAQWSPDGTQLVFSFFKSNAQNSKPAGGRALFIINSDGTGQRQLTPWTLGADGTPDWSRNGLIVFRAVQDEGSGVGNIFTIHPDATGLTQITHFTNKVISHKVGFSPDGSWIVFGQAPDGGSNDLFLCRIDGTELHPVTQTPLEEGSPDWTATS